jgi:hypothetical protein
MYEKFAARRPEEAWLAAMVATARAWERHRER